ncbi:hypothetical protein TUM3794_08420 [Shewanella colwelliana]|uniref:Uncharacterized protein n=1 Tax=Shewanella colwelliana TaxID=23 RepID=A0ABQ4NWC8_SHECO|nr:hypothetical protein TUM3794_08420 [Shewanella colwelliana]
MFNTQPERPILATLTNTKLNNFVFTLTSCLSIIPSSVKAKLVPNSYRIVLYRLSLSIIRCGLNILLISEEIY